MTEPNAGEMRRPTSSRSPRRVVASELITLDGVMEAPDQWSFTFWNDEAGKLTRDKLVASDALL